MMFYTVTLIDGIFVLIFLVDIILESGRLPHVKLVCFSYMYWGAENTCKLGHFYLHGDANTEISMHGIVP